MKLPRRLVVWALDAQGLHDAAAHAERMLPPTVDSERDADLVSRLGVNPADLPGIARRRLPRPSTHRGTWPVPGSRARPRPPKPPA